MKECKWCIVLPQAHQKAGICKKISIHQALIYPMLTNVQDPRPQQEDRLRSSTTPKGSRVTFRPLRRAASGSRSRRTLRIRNLPILIVLSILVLERPQAILGEHNDTDDPFGGRPGLAWWWIFLNTLKFLHLPVDFFRDIGALCYVLLHVLLALLLGGAAGADSPQYHLEHALDFCMAH